VSTSASPPSCRFHPGIQDLLAATADDLGLPYVRTMSGAGHDAQEISADVAAHPSLAHERTSVVATGDGPDPAHGFAPLAYSTM
jgi:hypothetical protein